jgi:16S rRNA (guanine966-N2)-methyltransferase
VRIISGKFKGHQLVSFQADHIRPTTDRVKETLFNKLMFQMEGARVLDLFCGTGNLGLEALSRGAQSCLFVEKSPKSIQITRQNLEKLKVPTSDFRIITMDALQFLKTYEGPAFDIVFADPPFTQKLAHSVMQNASQSKVISQTTIMAIESEKKEQIEDLYSDLKRFDAREFGDKILSFFAKKELTSSHE